MHFNERLSLSLKKKKQSGPVGVAEDRALDKGQSRPKHVARSEMHKRPSTEDEALPLNTRSGTACEDIFDINISDGSLLRAMPFCDDGK